MNEEQLTDRVREAIAKTALAAAADLGVPGEGGLPQEIVRRIDTYIVSLRQQPKVDIDLWTDVALPTGRFGGCSGLGSLGGSG